MAAEEFAVGAGRRGEPFRGAIAVLSVAVCGLVALLMAVPRPGIADRLDVTALPTVNAALNGTAAVLLVAGYVAIRRGRRIAHRRFMVAAFATSGLFLVSYVVYHLFSDGPTRYVGAYRGAYLFVLASHVVLAAAVVPFALVTVSRGLAERFDRHRRIARITFPVWLYVSVTGVAIYWMLYGP